MPDKKKTSPASMPRYNYKSLLTYRLLVLSNTLGKGAVRYYAKRFHIPLAEWRLIAALGLRAPISVIALSSELSTDKGWISRTAAALVKKGLVKTYTDRADARKVLLDLTPKGRTLYRRVVPAARARQERLLAVLSNKERAFLDSLLEKLQQRANEMLEEKNFTQARPGPYW